ncbi:hypothetical protein ACEWY4_013827 [Coilia grayii]|uniref:RING-type E3 ubiquitin transferase n=1 Tax=Coilia grayii TaxID=363190 RepID=A0ABD1JXG9_9TELE
MALADDAGQPSTHAFLKNMDTLLRCPICFDFLSIAMMSPCSHNFCSLCIRKFLSYKLQCPVCNLSMTEQDLRNNRILDDLVKSFQDARKRLAVSSAVKRKAPVLPSPPQRGHGKEDGSALSPFFQRQPCTAAVSGSKDSEPRGELEVRPPRGKRARSSCHRTLTFSAAEEQREQMVQDPNKFTTIQVKKETMECEVTDAEVLPPPPLQQRGPKKVGSVLTDFFQKQSRAASGSEMKSKPKAKPSGGKQVQTSRHRSLAPSSSPEVDEEEQAFQSARTSTRVQAKKKDKPGATSGSASKAGREPKARPARGKPACTSGHKSALPTAEQESPAEVVVQYPSTSTSIQVKKETMDQELSSPSTFSDVAPVKKVECPVCEVPILVGHINSHLDTCLRGVEKKEALRSSSRRKPMAKVVYNLLSVAELKRRLRVCELSTHGSKEQMIKRHQEFLLIYNAECDALQPRSAKDIAKEVETNEKMRTKLEKTTIAKMVFRKDQTEEEIEAVHSNYRETDFTAS